MDRPNTDRKPLGQPTLAELLRQAKGTMTLLEFEARMPIDPQTDRHTPGEDNLSRMMNLPMLAWPQDKTILNLAKGTGFHVEDIIDACCRSKGLPLRRRRSRLEINLATAGYLDSLTDDEVADLVALVRVRTEAHKAMARARTAAEEAQPATPPPLPARRTRAARKAPAKQ